MTALTYTIYDNAQSANSGNYVVTGTQASSPATVADIPVYVGFAPSRITLYLGTSETAPTKILTWVKAMGAVNILNTFAGSSGDEYTVITSDHFTVAAVTSGAHEGQHLITLDKEHVTTGLLFTMIVER